jgi:hypothetical protein
MRVGHWRNIFSLSQALMRLGEGTRNHERKVHSIIHKADEIYNPRLCTCMPYQESYLILLLLVVLTRNLEPLVPLLPKLVVLTCVLGCLVHRVYNVLVCFHSLVSRHLLLLPLVVLTCILTHLVPLSLPIVVLTCILAHLVPLLPSIVVLTPFLSPLVLRV